MAISKLNFSGGSNIINPLAQFGQTLSDTGRQYVLDAENRRQQEIANNRAQESLLLQQAANKRAEDEALRKQQEYENKLKTDKATRDYLADVLKGPEQRQGILTDFIDQKTVNDMAFTDEELIAQGGVKQADGTWKYGAAPKTVDSKLAESIKRKTEAQTRLGEFAGSVEDIASSAGVGKLSNAEHRKELLGKYPDLGEKVLSDLITLQAADEKARTDKTSTIDKEITDLRKELNKIPREYGGLLDKEASKNSKIGSSDGGDSGKGSKRNRISDAQKALTATLNETFKGSSAKGATQVKALEAFDEMVASGVDPKVAAEVVGDSTKKDSTWWGLGSDTGEVKIPNDFKQQLLQRAKSSTIPGVGANSSGDGYTTTASERAALQSDATRLQNEIASLEKQKKLANMTPEEKTRLVINEAFNEFVNPKAKGAGTTGGKSTATVSGNDKANVADKVDEFGQTEKETAAAQERMLKDAGVRETAELKENAARFQELYTKKNKTEADFKKLEELAKYLDANGVVKQDLFKAEETAVPKAPTWKEPTAAEIKQAKKDKAPVNRLINALTKSGSGASNFFNDILDRGAQSASALASGLYGTGEFFAEPAVQGYNWLTGNELRNPFTQVRKNTEAEAVRRLVDRGEAPDTAENAVMLQQFLSPAVAAKAPSPKTAKGAVEELKTLRDIAGSAAPKTTSKPADSLVETLTARAKNKISDVNLNAVVKYDAKVANGVPLTPDEVVDLVRRGTDTPELMQLVRPLLEASKKLSKQAY